MSVSKLVIHLAVVTLLCACASTTPVARRRGVSLPPGPPSGTAAGVPADRMFQQLEPRRDESWPARNEVEDRIREQQMELQERERERMVDPPNAGCPCPGC